jgi:hypothetical protein
MSSPEDRKYKSWYVPEVDTQGLHLGSGTPAKMQTLKVHNKYTRRVWGTLYRIWRRGAMLKILWSGFGLSGRVGHNA